MRQHRYAAAASAGAMGARRIAQRDPTAQHPQIAWRPPPPRLQHELCSHGLARIARVQTAGNGSIHASSGF
eukprot:scaffold32639_cov112-Isochrysis_galbana.AAC.11